MNWYIKKEEDILTELETSPLGLTDKEVEKRLSTYGLNTLPKKEKESILEIFFKGFLDPLVILLLITFVFSIIINEIVDAFVILFIVLLDLILGTYQEWKAKNNADSLSKLIKVKSMVRRNKTIKTIDSIFLVPGDIVYLSSGDKIPADMRILESDNLKVNESVLTGESLDIYKKATTIKKELPLSERQNMLYSGTVVTTGRATCVIVSTGTNTEIGKIATTLTSKEETKSPLTIRMNKFSKQISILVVIIAIIITIVLFQKNLPGKEIFLSVIALSVSAMPEGLPLALTMALTIASNRMAKKRVIVKKLNSVESLGSCTVIASDKTGTLTINEQTAKIIVLPKIAPIEINSKIKNIHPVMQEIISLGALNNEATLNELGEYIGDSIDIAFLKLAEKTKISSPNIKILKQIPYESENGYSAIYYEENKKTYVTIKGSIEKVIAYSTYQSTPRKQKINKDEIRSLNTELASKGYRIIALAKKELTSNKLTKKESFTEMTFLGLVAFIDPLRKEAKKSIAECKKAGIKVVMITGDHPLTAYSIAKDLGIAKKETDIATSTDIDNAFKQGKDYFQKFIAHKTVFSRVTPLEKLEIVEAFKNNNESFNYF